MILENANIYVQVNSTNIVNAQRLELKDGSKIEFTVKHDHRADTHSAVKILLRLKYEQHYVENDMKQKERQNENSAKMMRNRGMICYIYKL